MQLDKTIRALGDPTRREILRVLRGGDLTAGELSSLFPITATIRASFAPVMSRAHPHRISRSFGPDAVCTPPGAGQRYWFRKSLETHAALSIIRQEIS